MKDRNLIEASKMLSISFIIIGIVFLVILPFFSNSVTSIIKIDASQGQQFGTMFSGIIGTLFGVAGSFLVYSSLISQNNQNRKQQVESMYFKLLDFHYENINQIHLNNYNYQNNNVNVTGRSSFITMKLQLMEILKIVENGFDKIKISNDPNVIIDIAYIIFYYGLDERWNDFIKEKLNVKDKNGLLSYLYFQKQQYEKENIDIYHTNQTYLSSYMRNMYNAIKIIDDNEVFDSDEKKKYIKIIRAQLSNPELYILYFNVRSRFGKKWIEKNYINKYELFTNIPDKYCGKYDHKEYFPKIVYEDNELNS